MIPAEHPSRPTPQGVTGEAVGSTRIALVAPPGAMPGAATALEALGYAVHPLADTGGIAVLRPDLVLLHSDLATATLIADLLIVAPVLVYGGDPEVADVVAWMRAGAADYLETAVGRREWHRRLRRAMTGRHGRDT